MKQEQGLSISINFHDHKTNENVDIKMFFCTVSIKKKLYYSFVKKKEIL